MDGTSITALGVALISAASTIFVARSSAKSGKKNQDIQAKVDEGANVLEGYDELMRNQAARITSQEEHIKVLEARITHQQDREIDLHKELGRLRQELQEVHKKCGSCETRLDRAVGTINRLRRELYGGEYPPYDHD